MLAGVKALRFASTRRAAGFGLDSGSAQATVWQLPPALISSADGAKLIIAASPKVISCATRK